MCLPSVQLRVGNSLPISPFVYHAILQVFQQMHLDKEVKWFLFLWCFCSFSSIWELVAVSECSLRRLSEQSGCPSSPYSSSIYQYGTASIAILESSFSMGWTHDLTPTLNFNTHPVWVVGRHITMPAGRAVSGIIYISTYIIYTSIYIFVQDCS